MKRQSNILAITMISLFCIATRLFAEDKLPFPEPQSASKAGKTLADSKHQWRKAPDHLPADAPISSFL